MSKESKPSKYLSSFYPTSTMSEQKPVLAEEVDKFKKPADFFKSSQQPSSQRVTLTCEKTFPGTNRFVASCSRGSGSLQSKSAVAVRTATNVTNTPQQRTPFRGLYQSVATTKALELQWSTNMKLAQKAELDSKKLHGPARGAKKNSARPDTGKSPVGKSLWGDLSFSEIDCQNQQNDPWFDQDVWGEDLPAEAVDECLRNVTSAQESSSQQTMKALLEDSDTFSSWVREAWDSTEVATRPVPPGTSVKTSLFVDEGSKGKFDDFSSYLSGDDEFGALLENFESQVPVETGLTVPLINLPLSERMPIGGPSGGKSTFVIKAKEAESPRKHHILSQSQRKLEKPTKSLPSPATVKLGFTTEWLRGQLEKINTEYSTLKEDVQVKEGESKLLREKLKTAEEEVKKHREEKAEELKRLRVAFEQKVKHLEKRLEASRVEAMFKTKEAESSMEKYRELRNVGVKTPESPGMGSFRQLQPPGCRPGEVLAEMTTDELYDDSMDQIVSTTRYAAVAPEVIVATQDTTVQSTSTFLRSRNIFGCNFEPLSSLKRVSAVISQGPQPKRELNHFLIPPAEYLPHTLLQTEFSEQDFENYRVRRPTLIELWGTSYNAFGPTALDDYEKAEVGRSIQADPAKRILAGDRYFSTLRPLHAQLSALSSVNRWGSTERKMAKNIVDLASSMTRELFATLGDPRLLQTAYTIYDRDPKVVDDFLDCANLVWEPLSADKWKDEACMELRRCLVAVGHICSVDHVATRYIVNPKALRGGRSSEYFPPASDATRQKPAKAELRVVLRGGERASNELRLMQMYRSLHSKKLTFISSLVTSLLHPNDESAARRVDNSVEASWQGRVDIEPYPSQHSKSSTKDTNGSASKDWVVSVPDSFLRALEAGILPVDLEGPYSVFDAPIDRCVTFLEKQMLELSVSNARDLRALVQREFDASGDLDLTKYTHNSPEIDVEMSRKRKISAEDEDNARKSLKLSEYRTPPFDKTLYTQFQRNDTGETVVPDDTSTQQMSPVEDDQLAKFERREEMAELKRIMLAEEKESERSRPISSKHSVGRLSKSVSADETAMVVDIEEMFQDANYAQTSDMLSESTWSSVSESDDECSDRTKLTTGNDAVTIEFVPDLVGDFQRKLHNAGLLEMLCEVFKDGGVLRFTHKLNGTLLATTLMLQRIVVHQRKEIEPHCSKLGTIVREMLYTRPSPRVLLELNVLLRSAVRLPGFAQMLCHNASSDTLIIRSDEVHFTRGSCLLEVVCILVTYASLEDADYQMYFQMVHWIYTIVCLQKKHLASLFELHYANRRRCMCISALNNTVVTICHRALFTYRGLYETSTDFIHLSALETLFTVGLQVLRLMYSYGSKSFLVTIQSQFFEYRELLGWLSSMHNSSDIYDHFRLSEANAFVVTELSRELAKPIEPPSYLDFGRFFRPNQPWPFDLDNVTSLLAAESVQD